MPRIHAPVVASTVLALALTAPAAAQRGPDAARPSGTIVVSDAGADVTVRCRAGERNVRVSGGGAQVRVNGRCREIAVSGAGSVVRANIVDRIRVTGSYARVSYRASSSGGAASVRNTGVGARVTRRG